MPNRGGIGSQVVGALTIGVAGLFIVAAIFQLNKNQGAGVANDATTVATTTVGNIFT